MNPQAPRSSIRRKLMGVVLLAVACGLVLFGGLQIWFEAHRYLVTKRTTMEATAAAFSAATADAVTAHSARGVTEALRGVGSLPGINFVSVTDRTGQVIASLGSGVRLAGDLDLRSGVDSGALRLLTTQTASFTVPVRHAGQVVGALTIVEDMADLWPRLRDLLVLNATVGAAALLIAILIVARLQSAITRPLSLLTRAIESMGSEGRYAHVSGIRSNDEVGLLANRFNVMVDAVRERDERLVEHRDNLEREVVDRTRDLALARDEAESANRAKSTFLATMSHEIRTPMTGLLVMAELLASGELPASARRYADVICRSGTALLAIINDILDFSKIEAGKLQVEKIPTNIRDVVQTVISLFYARACEKGLDLAAFVAPDVPATVLGDPVRLQQIVSNLVNNALKFTSAGDVRVSVTYRDGTIVISVRDTGIGISEAQKARIFEAFAQADGTTTRQFGGTGLGLAISNRLAEAMGGAIRVDSVPDVGSDFRFEWPTQCLDPFATPAPVADFSCAIEVRRPASAWALRGILAQLGVVSQPVERADVIVSDGPSDDGAHARLVRLVEPGHDTGDGPILKLPIALDDVERLLRRLKTGEAVALAPQAKAERHVFVGARVLVADDTAVNREVMVEALKRFAIVPDLVVDGREAVEAAGARRYDLIFMDGSMPELDGFAASRAIRAADGPCRTSPIVALTAHVVGTAANAWRDAGMDGVLYKPFTMVDLERTLVAMLEGFAAQPQSPPPQDAGAGNDSLIDASVLEDILALSAQGGSGFAARIFGLFLTEAPRTLETLSDAVARGAWEDVARAAHAVKSMSHNVGAKVLATASADVERAASQGPVDGASLKRLAEVAAATCASLEERVRDLPPPLAATA